MEGPHEFASFSNYLLLITKIYMFKSATCLKQVIAVCTNVLLLSYILFLLKLGQLFFVGASLNCTE